MRSPCRGFTLIELIVVISIISLLVAILLPALQRVREASQSTICLSNERQIGIAMATYHVEYNERLIPVGQNNSGGRDFTWRSLLIHYLDGPSMNAFRCPSKYEPGKNTPVNAEIGVAPHSYGMNFQLRTEGLHLWGSPINPSLKGGKLDDIVRPSSTLVIGDLGYPTNPTSVPEQWVGDIGAGNWGYMRMPNEVLYHHTNDPWNIYPRHLEKANVLFYDGHARSISVTDDLKPYPPGHPNCIYSNQ